MQPYFAERFANPSAIHKEGQEARQAIEKARLNVARALGVRPEEVTWTASGTEANNLALYGLLRQLTEEEGRPITTLEIITPPIEHPSILEVVKHLEIQGATIKYVPVKETGRMDLAALAALLTPQTALVTCAYVNSEIGVVEDVKHLTRLVRRFNIDQQATVRVHLDAAQAPLWLPCKLEPLGVDMLSLDAGKCGGPKGVGLLVRRHGVRLKGVVLGGGQETGLRAGTENTPLIVGAAKALVLAQEDFKERSERIGQLRDQLIERLTRIAGVDLNGSQEYRVANNVNVSIAGVEAEFAAVTLDTAGIACSTKSACGSGKGAGSSVVRTITGNEQRALTSLRFTLGEDTKVRDLDRLVGVLTTHIEKTRAFTEKLTQ